MFFEDIIGLMGNIYGLLIKKVGLVPNIYCINNKYWSSGLVYVF
jgi:hypothetical protein